MKKITLFCSVIILAVTFSGDRIALAGPENGVPAQIQTAGEGTVQNVYYHTRWRSHGRWGSPYRPSHYRWRSHHRWGSPIKPPHNRWRSHHRQWSPGPHHPWGSGR